MLKTIKIREGQLGLLFRDGRFQRVLEAGLNRVWSLGEIQVATVDLRQLPTKLDVLELLRLTQPAVIESHFEVVATGDRELALVSADGEIVDLVPPGTRRFYPKRLRQIAVERVNLAESLKVSDAWVPALKRLATQSLVLFALVGERQEGLLYVDGQLKERLGPGEHAFWRPGRQVSVSVSDLRLQTLEVAGQEILTKDRVALRVNLTALYRLADPVKAEAVVADVKDYLYKELQLALRQAIGQRDLESLLADKRTLDVELAEAVRLKAEAVGVEVTALGLKDIILPGDMRALMNRVIEAEKTAQANVIKRREETAATRSLLNTAQIMKDNPIMLRLKELEALEKIAERVGTLSVSDGLNGLLRLVKITETDKAA